MLKRKIISLCLVALYFACRAPEQSKAQQKEGETGLLLPKRDLVQKIPFEIISKAFKALTPTKPSASLKDYFPPAMDQKDQQSCVSFSVAYSLVSYVERILRKRDYHVQKELPDFSRVYSPAFVFNGVKSLKGSSNCNSGIDFYDGFKFIESKGVSTWAEFPYLGGKDECSAPISQNIYNKAQGLIGYVFYRTGKDLETLKFYIGSFNPVIIGIYTSENMFSEGSNHALATSKKEYIWNPVKGDFYRYHAMLCVGYDDVKKRFLLLNSWGAGWGNEGYCYISYEKFFERAREFYIAKPEGRSFLTLDRKAKKNVGYIE